VQIPSSRIARVTTVVLAAAALSFTAPGCSSADEGDEDYSDATWSALSTSDTADAVLEDANSAEDPADPSDETDDADDPTEEGDADDEAEAADIAPLPVDAANVGIAAGALKKYKNSVLANCADPGLMRTGGANPTFFVACTGGGYPQFESDDLVHWKPAGHVFSLKNRPSWASKNFWAPELHHIGDGVVAYFSAFSARRNKSCIGAARAASATQKFTDLGRPLVCDRNISLIDAHEFTDGAGKHFLYYKTEGNAQRPQQHTIIYGQQLGADGTTFVGKRHRLLRNSLAWEGDVVEGPWVIARGKFFYMFYSGFRYCNGTYGVGVARARSPLGPFKKRGGPILHSNAAWSGPGHNSIVRTGGHDFIVYQAWRGAHQCDDGGNRELLVDRVGWKGGWPVINNGTPSRGLHTAPVQ
jgi:arabinan endo-1,5-alpha-L-arabinosidase